MQSAQNIPDLILLRKKSRRFHLICQKGNLASNREICSLLNPHRGEVGSSPVRERETNRRLAADRSSYRKKETVSAKTKLNEKTDTACGTMFALKQSCQRGRDKASVTDSDIFTRRISLTRVVNLRLLMVAL